MRLLRVMLAVHFFGLGCAHAQVDLQVLSEFKLETAKWSDISVADYRRLIKARDARLNEYRGRFMQFLQTTGAGDSGRPKGEAEAELLDQPILRQWAFEQLASHVDRKECKDAARVVRVLSHLAEYLGKVDVSKIQTPQFVLRTDMSNDLPVNYYPNPKEHWWYSEEHGGGVKWKRDIEQVALPGERLAIEEKDAVLFLSWLGFRVEYWDNCFKEIGSERRAVLLLFAGRGASSYYVKWFGGHLLALRESLFGFPVSVNGTHKRSSDHHAPPGSMVISVFERGGVKAAWGGEWSKDMSAEASRTSDDLMKSWKSRFTK